MAVSTAQAISGTAGNDVLVGTSSADTISGLDGADRLTGLSGNDSLDGGDGLDTAVYASLHANYQVAKTDAGNTVTALSGSEGADTLVNVERLRFSDAKVAIDLDGSAGNVARIIGVVFGAGAIANQDYVRIGLSYLDGGTSYQALMQLAIDAALGGVSDPGVIVDLLYGNVIGGAPPEGARAEYMGMLESGAYTAGSLGVLAAATSFNEANINLTGLGQTGLEYN